MLHTHQTGAAHATPVNTAPHPIEPATAEELSLVSLHNVFPFPHLKIISNKVTLS